MGELTPASFFEIRCRVMGRMRRLCLECSGFFGGLWEIRDWGGKVLALMGFL